MFLKSPITKNYIKIFVSLLHDLNIGGKARRKENHWEDQYIGGWTILKWILDR
jgi:hypothetical protein